MNLVRTVLGHTGHDSLTQLRHADPGDSTAEHQPMVYIRAPMASPGKQHSARPRP